MPRKRQWIAIVGMGVLLVCVLAALYEFGRRRDEADWTPAPFGRAVLASPGPAGLPSLGPAENESMFGSRIQRTMTLLKAGTGDGRAPVRILFYGQSIMSRFWTSMVERDLRRRFPKADLTVENRAIGGFGAHYLCRTAAHDVWPLYPDLIVFHAYGGVRDGRLERFVADIRRNTTAEIMLITHHLNVHNAPPVDDGSTVHWRYVAQKYNCELVELRRQWKRYLANNDLLPRRLLSGDGVHPNAEGFRLIAAAVSRHFRWNPISPGGWCGAVRTYEAKRALEERYGNKISFTGAPWALSGSAAVGSDPNSALKLTFRGNRVDIISGWVRPRRLIGDPNARTIRYGTAKVLIDGKSPSANPRLYAITRPSPAPHIWFPAVRRIGHEKPLLLENWTLRITEANDDPNAVRFEFAFEVFGSKTGPDGTGTYNRRFVSNSGRVVIEPEDFSFEQTRGANRQIPPIGFEVKWKVVPLFQDVYAPQPPKDHRRRFRVTVAKLLANTRHTIEIIPNGDGYVPVEAIEVHRPPLR